MYQTEKRRRRRRSQWEERLWFWLLSPNIKRDTAWYLCVSLFLSCPFFCDEIPWCAGSSGNQVKSLDLSSHLPTDMIPSWQSSSKISSVITVKGDEKESMNVVQHHKYQPVWSRVCCWTCDNCLSRSRQKEKQLIFMIRMRWTKHTCLNDLSQKEHLYGFSPVWIRACCASCVNSN